MSHNLFNYAISQINYANAQRWPFIYMRDSRFVILVLKGLLSYGLIESFFVDYQEFNLNKRCHVFLKYRQGYPVFHSIKVFKRSGNHIFITKSKLIKLARRNPSTLFFLSGTRGVVAYNLKDLTILDNSVIFGGILLFSVEIW